MSATVVVTRNVSGRIRGFLASIFVEVAPGFYIGTRVNRAVRERAWLVLEDWFQAETDASIVMVWEERSRPGGQEVKVLGLPRIQFLEVDGLLLSYRPR